MAIERPCAAAVSYGTRSASHAHKGKMILCVKLFAYFWTLCQRHAVSGHLIMGHFAQTFPGQILALVYMRAREIDVDAK
jgi:hypothetical protein